MKEARGETIMREFLADDEDIAVCEVYVEIPKLISTNSQGSRNVFLCYLVSGFT